MYLSEHPALALIEVLVNLRGNPSFFPGSYQLMKIVAADSASTEVLAPGILASNWRENNKETQMLGDAWLDASSSALLAVPSAPSPESTNYLLNPNHVDAKSLTIEWSRCIQYDRRLFHLHE